MALPVEQDAVRDAPPARAANDCQRLEAEHLAHIEAVRARIEQLSAQVALLSLNAQLEACAQPDLSGFSVTADRLRDVASLTLDASLSGSILRETEDITALVVEQAARLKAIAWPADGRRSR